MMTEHQVGQLHDDMMDLQIIRAGEYEGPPWLTPSQHKARLLGKAEQRVTVYHAEPMITAVFDARKIMHEARARWNKPFDQKGPRYVPVAEVFTESEDEAHLLTNTIDSAWFENPDVIAFQDPCRSTSVGDIVKIDTGPHAGNVMVCLPVGWKELTDYTCPKCGWNLPRDAFTEFVDHTCTKCGHLVDQSECYDAGY